LAVFTYALFFGVGSLSRYMCYCLVQLTNHLFFFMIGLVVGGSDRVVNHVDPDRLGIVQEHIKPTYFSALKV